MTYFKLPLNFSVGTFENKTGTSKVGAISKAQKAQSFQNCRRGDSSGFLEIQFVAKYQENEGATLVRH